MKKFKNIKEEIKSNNYPNNFRRKVKNYFGDIDIDIIEWVDMNVEGNNRGEKWEKIFYSWYEMIFSSK